jgi:hypothetical protein
LLESTVDGSTWPRRFSSFEAENNRMAKIRNGWVKVLQDIGYSPRFISAEQIEGGALQKTSNAALVLSQSWAMDEREDKNVAFFLHNNTKTDRRAVLLRDGLAGAFDRHGMLRSEKIAQGASIASATNCIAGREGRPDESIAVDIAAYTQDRLGGTAGARWQEWLSRQLDFIPVEAKVAPPGCVRIHRYKIPQGRLLAFERNISYQMSEELKQAGGNEPLEKPIQVEATLREPAHVYDLRTQSYLGKLEKIKFTLDPWQPSLFALTQSKLVAADIVHTLSRPH